MAAARLRAGTETGLQGVRSYLRRKARPASRDSLGGVLRDDQFAPHDGDRLSGQRDPVTADHDLDEPATL